MYLQALPVTPHSHVRPFFQGAAPLGSLLLPWTPVACQPARPRLQLPRRHQQPAWLLPRRLAAAPRRGTQRPAAPPQGARWPAAHHLQPVVSRPPLPDRHLAFSAGWPYLPSTPTASSARFGCPGAGPSNSADVQPTSAICFYAASRSSYCVFGHCTTITTSSSCSPPRRGGSHCPCG